MESLARTANRGSVSTGYDIDNSLKVESDNNEYLERSTSGASDGSSTQHTISVWVKRTELGIDSEPVSAGGIGRFRFESDDTFSYQFRSGKEIITSRKFRDTSAWYHIVAVGDSSQSTASNRMKLYVNGVQETSFGTAVYQDQNQAAPGWGKNTTYSLRVGAAASSTRNFNGYIAEMYYIDGQVLDPTYFGEFDDNGIWIPKKFSGTHGTLDTYLDFSDSSNLGKNSGGTTDLSATNITAADQATDTPTNNFCIGNALVNFAPGGQTLVRGATKFSNPSGQNWQTITGTFALTSGKWYWEFESDGTGAFVGIADVEDSIIPQRTDGYFLGHNDDDSATSKSLGMYSTNGVIYNDNSGATGNSYGSGNRVGVALDMDNRKIYFAVGNTWVNSGDPANGTNGATWNTSWSDTVFPAGSCANNNSIFFVYGGFSSLSNISNVDANGYGGFYYTPPSGFYALCTKNLAEYG